MDRFDFLDTSIGLEYCADDEEIYIEVIESYLEEDRTEEVQALYEAKNWPEYRVVVHAIKSTSLTIGAPELSEKAKALELASASGDEGYILANHDEMVAMYKDLLGKIKAAL